jgi:hypothetical protein
MSKAVRVTRIYGRAGLLFGLMTAFMRMWASAVVGTMPASSREHVIEGAERDAQRMVTQGYRVLSSEWYELPLGLGYQKVIYELNEKPG